jgi:methylmalonyl-CoA mutase
MNFPKITADKWRAQVDKELAGAAFDDALVTRTPEGIAVQPLYTEREGAADGLGLALADVGARTFGICVRLGAGASRESVTAEIEGGADALWLGAAEPGATRAAIEAVDLGRTGIVVDAAGPSSLGALEVVAARAAATGGAILAFGIDPLGEVAAGRAAPAELDAERARLVTAVRFARERLPRAVPATVSTLAYHDAGADAADEIAFALSTGADYLEALLEGGLTPEAAGAGVGFRVASGRDIFGELCKLRALRLVWRKVLTSAGAASAPRTLVHAVCSSRTLARRDPWVNMLRVTGEMFAAILGGADLVTPAAYDQALGASSPLGVRVARNTGLVLREESSLGKVHDPAGGSYYFDARTDALAREAWKRFQGLERDGGIAAALLGGKLRDRLDAAWSERLERLRSRKMPVLGVTEFAIPDEKVPPGGAQPGPTSKSPVAVAAHRDSEAFE